VLCLFYHIQLCFVWCVLRRVRSLANCIAKCVLFLLMYIISDTVKFNHLLHSYCGSNMADSGKLLARFTVMECIQQFSLITYI
jgi:hypothetical protein